MKVGSLPHTHTYKAGGDERRCRRVCSDTDNRPPLCGQHHRTEAGLSGNGSDGDNRDLIYIKAYPRGFNYGFEYRNGISPSVTTSSWQHNFFLIIANET